MTDPKSTAKPARKGASEARRPYHVGVALGLSTGLYALSLAAVTTFQVAEDRALICRAAVLGVTFDPQLLADVLEPGTRPPDERTWARLWRYFDATDDGQMQFKRPIVREAAYANLPFGTRRLLHRRVGERIER